MNNSILPKIKRKIKYYYIFIRENIKYYIYKKAIVVEGYPDSRNFGDALNVYLLKKLTSKIIIYKRYLINQNIKSYAVLGSILQKCNRHSIIWGPGFIKDVSNCMDQFEIENLYAVRGYKTLNILKKNNYEISSVKIGDPALLLPLLHKHKFEKGNKIGILPHYIDKDNPWINSSLVSIKNVKIIDIESGQNVDKFLKDINECKVVISSTLHGLIIADSYNIKNVWVKFSDKIEGGNFKFNDYYSSINVMEKKPIVINEDSNLEEIIKYAKVNPVNIDLNELLNSFPG